MTQPHTFTLAQARSHNPCAEGWRTALAAHGPDLERPLTLADIARSNDAADALWCLRLLDWSDIALRRLVLRGVLLPACRRAHAAASPGTPEPAYLKMCTRYMKISDKISCETLYKIYENIGQNIL